MFKVVTSSGNYFEIISVSSYDAIFKQLIAFERKEASHGDIMVTASMFNDTTISEIGSNFYFFASYQQTIF